MRYGGTEDGQCTSVRGGPTIEIVEIPRNVLYIYYGGTERLTRIRVTRRASCSTIGFPFGEWPRGNGSRMENPRTFQRTYDRYREFNVGLFFFQLADRVAIKKKVPYENHVPSGCHEATGATDPPTDRSLGRRFVDALAEEVGIQCRRAGEPSVERSFFRSSRSAGGTAQTFYAQAWSVSRKTRDTGHGLAISCRWIFESYVSRDFPTIFLRS